MKSGSGPSFSVICQAFKHICSSSYEQSCISIKRRVKWSVDYSSDQEIQLEKAFFFFFLFYFFNRMPREACWSFVTVFCTWHITQTREKDSFSLSVFLLMYCICCEERKLEREFVCVCVALWKTSNCECVFCCNVLLKFFEHKAWVHISSNVQVVHVLTCRHVKHVLPPTSAA